MENNDNQLSVMVIGGGIFCLTSESLEYLLNFA